MARKTTARSPVLVKRRDALCAAVGVGVSLSFARRARGADEAINAPPSEDDILVFAYGEHAGEVITAADVTLGAQQILAYPMDPETRTVRDGTRLNQLLVTRIDPTRSDERTLGRSAGGIVAYSAVCTHTGCDVTEWDAEARQFQCPCHDSQFDPSDGARVVGGPAPRPLPSLPLRLDSDVVTVAGQFDSPVGFQQPGLDPFGF